MENQTDIKKIIINYGLIIAGINILINLATYATGTHLNPHWIFKTLGFVFFIILIVLGVKKFKQKNNSFLSFGQAVKIGVGIATISAIVGGIYSYVFMTFIEPDFMQQLMDMQAEQYLDAGMSDEQIEAAQNMGEKFSSPFMIATFGIIGSAIAGFIVSAISGAIMKKTEEDQY